jgi:hypothetical protein
VAKADVLPQIVVGENGNTQYAELAQQRLRLCYDTLALGPWYGSEQTANAVMWVS